MLLDTYGRSFRYLRLSVTDMCNYRCNYCLPDGMPCDTRHKLDVEHISIIAQAAAEVGIEKIRITGGEPTIRTDLPQIIAALKATPGINTVALTTNGYKLERELPRWVDAGLDQLNVSCDTLDARMFNTITGHQHLQPLLDGIALAQRSSLQSVKINTVLLREYNFKELDTLIDWASSESLTLRFIELMQTGDNRAYFERNHVSAEVVQSVLLESGWQLIEKAFNSGPAKEYMHPQHQGKIGFIAPYSAGFCDSCNRLRISSVGKLHLCLFGESGVDLMPWLERKDAAGLILAMRDAVTTKPREHYLHQKLTGATTNLAMLGG